MQTKDGQTKASGTIENTGWGEEPGIQLDANRRVARGHMTEVFHGGIEGEGAVEALLAYHQDGSAALVGFEHVVGRLGGRPGSFVLQFVGTLRNGTGEATWHVVRGSATGALTGLNGQGGYTWDGQTVAYTLAYGFE
jgi:Protein of unknown function (DUF3224)